MDTETLIDTHDLGPLLEAPGSAAAARDTGSLFLDSGARSDRIVLPRVTALGNAFERVQAHWQAAAREMAEPRHGAEGICQSLFGIVFVEITRAVLQKHSGAARNRGALPWLVQRAVSTMRERYSTRLTVTGLARELGVTPQHLIRTFRKTLGRSPRAVLEALRLEQACRLLQGSTLSIKEISHAVGFRDQRYFSRAFRRVLGQSPSQFRASA